jgi:hypothetical protein
LKEFFANIITFKKKLDEHFEDSTTRHKTKGYNNVKYKGNKDYPKLIMDMVSPSWKLLFEALFSHQLSLKRGKGFWQPRGTPEGGNGHEKREVGWVFIGKVRHQLSVRPADIQQP